MSITSPSFAEASLSESVDGVVVTESLGQEMNRHESATATVNGMNLFSFFIKSSRNKKFLLL